MEAFSTFSASTSSAEASRERAKTSPMPAREPGSTGHARVFGTSTPDSFASYDPATSSWRTSQLSLLEDLGVFSGTWPRAGMTRNGTAYRLQPLAPLTGGTGSGLLPTPKTTDHKINASPGELRRKAPSLGAVAQRPDLFPTPTAGDAKSAANRTAGRSDPDSKHHSGTTLTDFTRMWPTPTARDWKDTGDLTGVPENSLLPRVVDRIERETWATPTAWLERRPSQATGDPARWHDPARSNELSDRVAASGTPGSLNPTFVEWLQGFPKNWTEITGPAESGPVFPALPSESPTGSTDSGASGTR